MTDHLGVLDGVTWKIVDGLLELRVQEWRARQLTNILAESIRKTVWAENAKLKDFEYAHRASRMCYELLSSNHLTMVDRADAEILYDLPTDHHTYWLNSILNKVRFDLRTSEAVIIIADHFAKSVNQIMSS